MLHSEKQLAFFSDLAAVSTQPQPPNVTIDTGWRCKEKVLTSGAERNSHLKNFSDSYFLGGVSHTGSGAKARGSTVLSCTDWKVWHSTILALRFAAHFCCVAECVM